MVSARLRSTPRRWNTCAGTSSSRCAVGGHRKGTGPGAGSPYRRTSPVQAPRAPAPTTLRSGPAGPTASSTRPTGPGPRPPRLGADDLLLEHGRHHGVEHALGAGEANVREPVRERGHHRMRARNETIDVVAPAGQRRGPFEQPLRTLAPGLARAVGPEVDRAGAVGCVRRPPHTVGREADRRVVARVAHRSEREGERQAGASSSLMASANSSLRRKARTANQTDQLMRTTVTGMPVIMLTPMKASTLPLVSIAIRTALRASM